jgi:hypothetical protein
MLFEFNIILSVFYTYVDLIKRGQTNQDEKERTDDVQDQGDQMSLQKNRPKCSPTLAFVKIYTYLVP